MNFFCWIPTRVYRKKYNQGYGVMIYFNNLSLKINEHNTRILKILYWLKKLYNYSLKLLFHIFMSDVSD